MRCTGKRSASTIDGKGIRCILHTHLVHEIYNNTLLIVVYSPTAVVLCFVCYSSGLSRQDEQGAAAASVVPYTRVPLCLVFAERREGASIGSCAHEAHHVRMTKCVYLCVVLIVVVGSSSRRFGIISEVSVYMEKKDNG